jgi:DHA2 family multidrug resistance protein
MRPHPLATRNDARAAVAAFPKSDEFVSSVLGMTEAAVAADPAEPPRPTGIRFVMLVFFATIATTAYDFTWTVVSVALPHMQGTFSTTPDQIAWVLIGFMLGSATATASAGWFSNRFGRKNIFLFATAGYTITLIGCGMSETLIDATVWRFMQGLVGAPLIPLGQTIVVDAFPKHLHGKATSIWGIGVMVGSVAGPVGGGFLLEDYSWPWVFYVTVPVGVIAFIGTWIFVPATKPDKSQKFDWFGFMTLVGGAGMLQLALARGEREEWFESTEVVIEFMIAAFLIYLFIMHTIFAKTPFVSRALFADRNFMIGMLFVAIIGSIIVLPNFLLPLLLQQVAGYPPAETGWMMMYRGAGVLCGLVVVGQIAERFPPKALIVFGLTLMAVPTIFMAQWTVQLPVFEVAWTNFVQGIGGSFIWVPISTLALGHLGRKVQDQGYSLFYLFFELGSSIGVALIVGRHVRDTQINHAALTEHVNPFNELFRYEAIARNWSHSDAAGLAALEAEIGLQSTMIAYNNAFFTTLLMAVGLIPVLYLFRTGKKKLKAVATPDGEPPPVAAE